jgi:hypothetical protein
MQVYELNRNTTHLAQTEKRVTGFFSEMNFVLLSITILAACDDSGGAGFSLRGASAPQILVAACRYVGQAPGLRRALSPPEFCSRLPLPSRDHKGAGNT